jgi:voltage-gated potassium channel Kch
MKKRMKSFMRNTFILMIISIIIGSSLKIDVETDSIFKIKFYYSLVIYMNLLPIATFILKFKRAKKRPIFFIGFVFYYLIILPSWTAFALKNGLTQELNESISGMLTSNIILGLNICLLLISQIFIMKYVFIDIITGRRKASNSDIGIVFLTYITLGITFGFLYVLLLKNNHDAISGMLLENYHGLEVYFRSIYFSFITLTSVGYGEVLPISLMAQLLVILESVMGVLLLSFSLGIVFSSNLNGEKAEEEKNNEDGKDDEYKILKAKLMKEFEETLDKNLENYKKIKKK